LFDTAHHGQSNEATLVAQALGHDQLGRLGCNFGGLGMCGADTSHGRGCFGRVAREHQQTDVDRILLTQAVGTAGVGPDPVTNLECLGHQEGRMTRNHDLHWFKIPITGERRQAHRRPVIDRELDAFSSRRSIPLPGDARTPPSRPGIGLRNEEVDRRTAGLRQARLTLIPIDARSIRAHNRQARPLHQREDGGL